MYLNVPFPIFVYFFIPKLFLCFPMGMKYTLKCENQYRLLAEWDGTSACEAVEPEFDSRSSHNKDFRKLVLKASCLALSIKNSVKTKPASSL